MTAKTETPVAAPIATPKDRERAALDGALARGVAWMGVAKWTSQIVSWVAMLIVARLLTPADFGVVGMAALYLGFVTMVSEFGIDAAILALRDLSDDVLRQMNALAVGIGVISFGVSCVIARFLAGYFHAPELTGVLIAMSLIFVVGGFRVVPQALLQRSLHFRLIALAEAAQAFTVASVTVTLAFLGFRYWTLVWGAVLGSTMAASIVLLRSRCAYVRPRWHDLRSAIVFSRQTIITRVAWYCYDNSDFFVAGRLLGKEALGAYTLGWQLATSINEKITTLIIRVTPSVLSAAQRDTAALRRYVLSVTEVISLITFPATVGLALVAPDVVTLALGDKWMAVVAPLRLLAVYTGVRSVTPLLAQVLAMTGENARVMRINIVAAVLMPIAFVVASRWGIAGIAAAWMFAHPLFVVLPSARAAFRRAEMTTGQYLRAVAPALSGVLVMSAAVMGVHAILPARIGPAGSLVIGASLGAVIYVSTVLLLYRERVRTLVRFAQSHLRPARPT